MKALYRLREALVDVEVTVSIESHLYELEKALNPNARHSMRQLGYQFADELENAKEMLTGEDYE